MAEVLRQQAIHDTIMQRPHQHVPNAPDPRLVDYYRFKNEINVSASYAATKPAAPKVYTDADLRHHDLASLFGKDANFAKANQLTLKTPRCTAL